MAESASANEVTVYRFEVWDRAAMKKVAGAGMATAEVIRRLKGEADLESALVVAKANIDARGYFDDTMGNESSRSEQPLTS